MNANGSSCAIASALRVCAVHAWSPMATTPANPAATVSAGRALMVVMPSSKDSNGPAGMLASGSGRAVPRLGGAAPNANEQAASSRRNARGRPRIRRIQAWCNGWRCGSTSTCRLKTASSFALYVKQTRSIASSGRWKRIVVNVVFPESIALGVFRTYLRLRYRALQTRGETVDAWIGCAARRCERSHAGCGYVAGGPDRTCLRRAPYDLHQ